VVNAVLLGAAVSFVTRVDICSSGHTTEIICFFDCPMVAAIVLAMDDEPPAVADASAVAVALTSTLTFTGSGIGTGIDAETVVLAECDAVEENDRSLSLLVDSVFLLLKPVSILKEAPCVLLATMRQKPRMVVSGDASPCNNFMTSAEST